MAGMLVFWAAKRMMRARSTARRGAASRRLKLSSSAFSWQERAKAVFNRARVNGVGWRSRWWHRFVRRAAVGYGQHGSLPRPEQGVQPVGFHEGRFKRSKVLGAVRVKAFWSRTFLVRALTRDSRWSGR